MASFPRWREAQDAWQKRQLAQQHGLSGLDVRALERLSENLAACGPHEQWKVGCVATGFALRAGLLATLLSGLTIPELDRRAVLPDLVRACRVRNPNLEVLLQAALEEHLPLPAAPKPEKPPAVNVATAKRSLEAWTQARQIDLALPVPQGVLEDAARELGVTGETAKAELGKLRKARGIRPVRVSPERFRHNGKTAATTREESDMTAVAEQPAPETAAQNGKALTGLKARLAAEIQRRGLDLTQPIPMDEQLGLATVLGTTRNTISNYLPQIRSALGISVGGPAAPASSEVKPAQPSEPLAQPSESAPLPPDPAHPLPPHDDPTTGHSEARLAEAEALVVAVIDEQQARESRLAERLAAAEQSVTQLRADLEAERTRRESAEAERGNLRVRLDTAIRNNDDQTERHRAELDAAVVALRAARADASAAQQALAEERSDARLVDLQRENERLRDELAAAEESLVHARSVQLAIQEARASSAGAEERLGIEEADLTRVMDVARKHGWNGIENSKILSEFLDRQLTDHEFLAAGAKLITCDPALRQLCRDYLGSVIVSGASGLHPDAQNRFARRLFDCLLDGPQGGAS